MWLWEKDDDWQRRHDSHIGLSDRVGCTTAQSVDPGEVEKLGI
jgi:hypothetical protein